MTDCAHCRQPIHYRGKLVKFCDMECRDNYIFHEISKIKEYVEDVKMGWIK